MGGFMKVAHMLFHLTHEKVSAYFDRYKATNPEHQNILQLFAKAIMMTDPAYTSKDIFRVVVQMHILGILEDKVDSDTSRLPALLKAMDPYSSELEELWMQHKGADMSQVELATIAVNNLVIIWNRNLDKFAEV